MANPRLSRKGQKPAGIGREKLLTISGKQRFNQPVACLRSPLTLRPMKTKAFRIELLEARIAPATFVVTSLLDPIEQDKVTLREALAMADAAEGPDIIVFDLPAPPLHGANIIKLTTGQLTSEGSVTIKGPGASKLIIDGNGTSRIFLLDDANPATDSPVTIKGLSIVHGLAPAGGGIFSRESLTLKKSIVSGNVASMSAAGGILVSGDASAGAAPIDVRISNSVITGNSATGFGGGLDLVNLHSISINKTRVTGNSTTDGSGGGIYASLTSAGTGMTITDCVISGNQASLGGGLFLESANNNPASKITISRTKITGNTSTNEGEGGGGIYLAGGHALITGSMIRANAAVFNGGGIEAKGFASLKISRSTVSGNQTTTDVPYMGNYDVGGGGLSVRGNGSGVAPVTITDSHFTDNSSKQNGGGVFARNGIDLRISGSIFSGNRANVSGGGVDASGTGAGKVDLTVIGGVFSENVASGGGGISAGESGVISITGAKVTGNIGSAGGGMALRSSAQMTLKNTVVTGNVGGIGGGLFIFATPDFEIIGGSIKRNSASYAGGGIETYGATGSIRGVTISGNTARLFGGGIFNSGNGAANVGTLTIQIAKVIANIAPTDPNVSGPADRFIFV